MNTVQQIINDFKKYVTMQSIRGRNVFIVDESLYDKYTITKQHPSNLQYSRMGFNAFCADGIQLFLYKSQDVLIIESTPLAIKKTEQRKYSQSTILNLIKKWKKILSLPVDMEFSSQANIVIQLEYLALQMILNPTT